MSSSSLAWLKNSLVILASVALVSLSLGAILLFSWRFSNRNPPNFTAAPAKTGLDPEPRIRQWHSVDGIPRELAQFESVFWEPDDTTSLRTWLADAAEVDRADILEIGVGTGIVSIAALRAGANSVVATDINPMACMNARYNAELLELSDRFEARQVPTDQPGPFSVLDSKDRFDLIVSNPPWENATVEEVAAHALYDPQFALLDGLLSEGQQHLKPDGKLLLAYGAKTAIQRIIAKAGEHGWQVDVADPRQLSSLPEVFLPGMLLVLQKAGN